MFPEIFDQFWSSKGNVQYVQISVHKSRPPKDNAITSSPGTFYWLMLCYSFFQGLFRSYKTSVPFERSIKQTAGSVSKEYAYINEREITSFQRDRFNIFMNNMSTSLCPFTCFLFLSLVVSLIAGSGSAKTWHTQPFSLLLSCLGPALACSYHHGLHY